VAVADDGIHGLLLTFLGCTGRNCEQLDKHHAKVGKT